MERSLPFSLVLLSLLLVTPLSCVMGRSSISPPVHLISAATDPTLQPVGVASAGEGVDSPAMDKDAADDSWRALPADLDTANNRVAICLVGSARHFELTSASLKRHLLQSYPQSDVFIIASMDETSWKLSLLSTAPNIVHFSVARPRAIAPAEYPKDVLRVKDLKSTLHQYSQIEACAAAIQARESNLKNITYDWILWSRLDSYWSSPPPLLSSLNPKAYSVPGGAVSGGLNDKLGIGPRHLALQALKRFSSLSSLSKARRSRLIPEKALLHQLRLQRIPFQKLPVPFCTLSYSSIKGRSYFQLAQLRTPAAANGITCRPCSQGRLLAPSYCNPHVGYEPEWERIFWDGASWEEKEAVEYAWTVDVKKCAMHWEAFEIKCRERGATWNAASGEEVCRHLKPSVPRDLRLK